MENYTVYALVEVDTLLVYYVGYSNDYRRRYREHAGKIELIEDLLQREVRLVPGVLGTYPTKEIAMEYELRWIYHAIQTRQPIINRQTQNIALVCHLQSMPTLELINLPDNISVWNDVLYPALRAVDCIINIDIATKAYKADYITTWQGYIDAEHKKRGRK